MEVLSRAMEPLSRAPTELVGQAVSYVAHCQYIRTYLVLRTYLCADEMRVVR
jgi:hypothetical protein